MAKDIAGKARCGCVYHAEDGEACEHDLALARKTSSPDVRVTGSNGSSVYLFHPLSDAGETWVMTKVDPEAQYLGRALVVEHRYLEPIILGMLADGIVVVNDQNVPFEITENGDVVLNP